jgi:hypothetical protein
VVLSHGFGATSDLCVPTGNSDVKVEWTLLTAPTYKPRCGARTISHVHPRSAPVGAQAAQQSQRSRLCHPDVLPLIGSCDVINHKYPEARRVSLPA